MIAEGRELEQLVEKLYSEYRVLDEDFTSIQLSEEKWSIKEIFGYLIDSAANNYERYLRLQEEEKLSFPGYSPDWVKTVPYNSFPYSSLLSLWREYNRLLSHIFVHLRETGRADFAHSSLTEVMPGNPGSSCFADPP